MSTPSNSLPHDDANRLVADSAADRDAAVSQSSLDWVETPLRSLVRLAWPIVVSMLSASVMTLADTLMVSTLGTWALAGVALAGTTAFILVCLPIGVLGGIKILVSQSIGAGKPQNVKIYLVAGLWLALLMAVGSALASLVVANHIGLVTATAEAGTAARTYLRIAAIGAFPMLVRVAVEQVRLSINDSQTPMRVNVLANILNVGFNYLFIFVLEMGVAGAAIGTLVANIIGCLAILWVQAGDGYDFKGVRRHHFAGIWRLGLPSGIQFVLEMGSFATMVAMLTRLSDIDGAANQIAIQVIHFGFLPCMAIGQAASVMAGQAVGARRRDLVQVVTNRAFIPTAIYSGTMTLLFIALAPSIVSLFTEDPELTALATRLLYVAAAFQIVDGINIISRSVLQGTGDVRFCAWAGILLSWMMTPPLTWFFGYHMGLGAFGGWIGLCIDIFVGTTVFVARVRGTRWHRAADRSLEEL